MQTGRFTEALTALEGAAKLQPDNPDALNSLGVAQMQAGRFDDAIATLRGVVKLQPNSASAQDNLGVALMQAHHVDDALAAFRRAAQLQPDDPLVHGSLGQALLQAGHPREAAVALQHAVDAKPDSPEALVSLAWVQATERDALNPDNAVRLASRAAELTGNRDAHVLDVLAAALAVDGRMADAVRTSEAAEKLATAGSDPQLTAEVRARLDIYRRRLGS
jgi:Flp pilus assembly protein TadD